MTLEDDIKQALTPEPPIKRGRLLTGRGGNVGETVWVEVEGSPISQRLICATAVVSDQVVVIGDRVFDPKAARTSLSRTLEYSRFRPLGVPTTGGKIKYFYRVFTGGKFQYWVGGWKEDPVFLFDDKNPSEPKITNLADDGCWVDFGIFIAISPVRTGYFMTVDNTGATVYQSRTLAGDNANFFVIGSIRHSFFYAPGRLVGTILNGSYTSCYQGVVISGFTGSNTAPQYSLPNILSPYLAEAYNGTAPDNTGLVRQTYAINSTGDRGVGRLAKTPYADTQLYWLEAIGGVEVLTLLPLTVSDLRTNYSFDCFDTKFSVFSQSDLSLTEQKTVEVDLYNGSNGTKLETETTTVFPIPQAQRSQSPLLLAASYYTDA